MIGVGGVNKISAVSLQKREMFALQLQAAVRLQYPVESQAPILLRSPVELLFLAPHQEIRL